MQTLNQIREQARKEIKKVSDLNALEAFRLYYLGKKGILTDFLKNLGKLPAEERPRAGLEINSLKSEIEDLIKGVKEALLAREVEESIAGETLDITLPGRRNEIATTHPITKAIDSLKQIFGRMGFLFMEGPEIEDDYHNFTALNIPPLHPARAMQDTFYFADGLLLRSQTSTVQIRTMNTIKPPLRMVALGRVYRRDFDLTHTPMFHQMECLMVDKGVSFAHLRGLLHYFLREFFERNIDIRFRPSYFPFTEPSAEADITCLNCSGKGCRICKGTGWLEVLGCGMVHPNVLHEVGIHDPAYTGFAFGLGIDRITLLKYQIPDLRALFENDLRFLDQFKVIQ